MEPCCTRHGSSIFQQVQFSVQAMPLGRQKPEAGSSSAEWQAQAKTDLLLEMPLSILGPQSHCKVIPGTGSRPTLCWGCQALSLLHLVSHVSPPRHAVSARHVKSTHLGGQQPHAGLSIHEREEGGLLPPEELLDHYAAACREEATGPFGF